MQAQWKWAPNSPTEEQILVLDKVKIDAKAGICRHKSPLLAKY